MWDMEEGVREGEREGGGPEPTNGIATDPHYFIFYYGNVQTHPQSTENAL